MLDGGVACTVTIGGGRVVQLVAAVLGAGCGRVVVVVAQVVVVVVVVVVW